MRSLGDTIDLASGLARAPSLTEIADGLHRRAAALGVGTYAFGTDGDPARFGNTWPAEWVERYIALDLMRADPLVRDARQRVAPYTWRDVPAGRPLTAAERRAVELAGEHGWRDGFCIPVHGPQGYLALAVFAGRGDDLAPEERALLHFSVVAAHDRALALDAGISAGRPVRLTGREREVLSWFAAGKTDWETSRILGVSEQTVRWHADNVRRKFGARNRVQAVAQAVWRGLIQL